MLACPTHTNSAFTFEFPNIGLMLIIRGMTMVVITSWMGVDKCHPDQVRNSGFGSNYPSSLSDPSITSITPLLISSIPCRLSWKRWRCRLSLGGDGIDIQSIRHFVKSWEYAAAIVSQDENFGLDFTQTHRLLPAEPLHAWHLSLPLINRWKLPPCA